MDRGCNLDWSAGSNALLLNPRLDPSTRARLEKATSGFANRGFIWLASSGTTQRVHDRLVAHTRQTLLASAAAVNRHLSVENTDRWLNVLPDFHVGGLSIFARAYLAGIGVSILDKWSTSDFTSALERDRCTLTSLVPTQMYDLIRAKIRAPAHLRAVVVGGGALLPQLRGDALRLGWPVLASYGLTEFGSQVATTPLANIFDQPAKLCLLDHVEARENQEQIEVRGASSLRGQLFVETDGQTNWIETPENAWWPTGDRGQVQANDRQVELQIFGRAADEVKILGELVSLSQLDARLSELGLRPPFAVIAVKHERRGHRLVLAVKNAAGDLDAIIERYHQKSMPFERLDAVHVVPAWPEHHLGKVSRAEISRRLTDLNVEHSLPSE